MERQINKNIYLQTEPLIVFAKLEYTYIYIYMRNIFGYLKVIGIFFICFLV